MAKKQEQLELVEKAIEHLEKKESLTPEERELYKDLIILREQINQKDYEVSWQMFLRIILRFCIAVASHEIIEHLKI
ncbi:hypothetical protein [Chitinophaga sp. CF418]|uniref:hypothetical protein n=1 Tax=Chitinophaga sp. CF418 TaxID=1855287 RepID=UPI00091EA952|nr:hypothetical protein [Chitinophaga sp. CF418]SHN22401.1 hypothetical protein SAMN05216311_10746 [Chitinophaga sp. CF418]